MIDSSAHRQGIGSCDYRDWNVPGSAFKCLRISIAKGVSLILKAEKHWCPHSKPIRQREQILSLLRLLYFSDLPWMGWGPLHREGKSALLSLLIQFSVSSRITLTDTPWVVFNQTSQHFVVQSSWHIKLTLMVLFIRKSVMVWVA